MSEEFGTGNQSQVRLDTYRGEKALIKSVPHPDMPILRTVERWLIQREGRALRTLQDLEGVPNYLGSPDSYSIAMEYCPGTLLSEVDEDRVGLSYIQSLESLVSKIHERGIVHSDLKKKDNLLITDQNEPVIIDFGTHFSKKTGFRPVNNFLYRQFHQMDNNAVSKLKNNFCPGDMTQRDRDRLESPTFLERADRFRRDYVWDW